jgi:diguanylate cyclase (GGDEF)-like protein
MSETNAASERTESPEGTPEQERSAGLQGMLRWPLGLSVAVAPLIAVATLRAPLELPDALVGAGVLLSLALVVAVTVLLRPRLVESEREAAPAGDRGGSTSFESGSASPAGSVSSDPLTGLPTFQPFSQRLLAEFQRVKRSEGLLTLMLVDVNHLGRINEQFGAEVGDQVLRQVAACLEMSKRMSDVLARMGDDEFGLLLPDCEAPGARAFVERVQQRLARESIRVQIGDRSTSLWIGICAGIAICDGAADADELLTAAVDDLNAARDERDRRRQRWEQSA